MLVLIIILYTLIEKSWIKQEVNTFHLPVHEVVIWDSTVRYMVVHITPRVDLWKATKPAVPIYAWDPILPTSTQVCGSQIPAKFTVRRLEQVVSYLKTVLNWIDDPCYSPNGLWVVNIIKNHIHLDYCLNFLSITFRTNLLSYGAIHGHSQLVDHA